MGPTVILDKSSFQCLSFDDIVMLHKYYFVVCTPILIMEILGDLAKSDNNVIDMEKKVMYFAQKIYPVSSYINENHQILIVESLLGNKIEMRGKPTVLRYNKTVSENNACGVVIKESQVEELLHQWRKGDFSILDKKISSYWRNSTTNREELLEIKNNNKSFSRSTPEIRDLGMLYDYIYEKYQRPNFQLKLLNIIIKSFPIQKNIIQKIYLRWKQNDHYTIKEFAPYAFYCIVIKQLFIQGVVKNFISTKPTNEIDLLYLYYLPFSNIFSSNDKFHKKMVKYCLRNDQSFISGSDLKNDLSKLRESNEVIAGKSGNRPHNRDTITYKYWEKYLDWSPDKEKIYNFLEAKESKKVNKIMQKYKNMKLKVGNDKSNSDIDFIIREIKVSPDDLCPCGSGKRFKNCCLIKHND